MEGATIAYTKDQEVTQNSNWNITEYAQDVTGYKITIPTIENAKTVKFTYELTIPANLGANKTIELQYTVYSGTEEIASPKILLLTEQNVKLELNVEPTVKDGETVYEEDELVYKIKIKNTGETIARNVKISNIIPEGTTLVGQNQTEWTIERLGIGESIIKEIRVKVNSLQEGETEKTITNTTTVKADYLAENLQNKIVNKVNKSDIKIETFSKYGMQFYAGDVISHSVKITNTTENILENVTVKMNIPEGTTYYNRSQDKEFDGLQYNWDEEKELATWNLKKLGINESITLNLQTIANELDNNSIEKKLIYNFEIDYDGDNKIVKSVYNGDIVRPNLDLKLEASKENVKVGENITYELDIKNTTDYTTSADINLELSDGLVIKSIETTENNEKTQEDIYEANKISLSKDIKAQSNIKIAIVANVTDTFKKGDIIKADAKVDVYGRNNDGLKESIETVFTKEITVNSSVSVDAEYPEAPNPIEPDPEIPLNPDNPENPDNPDNPTPTPTPDPKPTNPDDPDTPVEKIYTISGVAWLDENENGQKESSERLLKGILVKIKQINKDKVAEYLKDDNGEDLTAITNNNGEYVFKNLEPGQYILEFKYNTKTYKLTQVANKDSIPYESKTSEGTTVKTDTITIKNSNIGNIDIGLVLNSTFDLELNKYITRAVVQNNAGTTEYKYNNEQLAKLEIKAKQMASSTVFIEYVIEVKNNGAVPGSAQVIADYLPKELKFSSEMNTDWYQGTDGNLYTEKLKDVTIEPGETKQVSLILTKAMTENNTGTFVNAAEIYEDKNDFGLVDTNSTPANQEEKENDYSTAEIMISTATGSPAMYIGIIMACMLILGGGVYMINKKVINGKKSI